MTKVLYIIGKGRSGSTVLANVLGQVPGIVSVGELLLLYTRGFDAGFACGCGEPMADCVFWTDVIARGFSDVATPDPHEVARLQHEVLRWPNVPRLMAQTPGRSSWSALNDLTDVLRRLYNGIAAVSGANVIVDSSKWPASPTPLNLVPDIDVRLLHLVRDPRAVAHSWKQKKAQSDSRERRDMPRYSVLYSMTSYWARNATTEFIMSRSPSSLRMRYEDFSLHPATALKEIMRLVDEEPSHLPIDADSKIKLHSTHTAGGNPDRLKTGKITITPDHRWVDQQPILQRWSTTALSLPFLIRYGYPITHRGTGTSILGQAPSED